MTSFLHFWICVVMASGVPGWTRFSGAGGGRGRGRAGSGSGDAGWLGACCRESTGTDHRCAGVKYRGLPSNATHASHAHTRLG